MVRRSSTTSRGTTYWFQYFVLRCVPGISFAHTQLFQDEVLTIIKTKDCNRGNGGISPRIYAAFNIWVHLGTRLRKRQAREKSLKQPFIPLRFFLLFLCLGQVFSFITSSNLKQTRQAKNIKKGQKSSVRLSREALVARFFQRQTDKPHVEHALTIFLCCHAL